MLLLFFFYFITCIRLLNSTIYNRFFAVAVTFLVLLLSQNFALPQNVFVSASAEDHWPFEEIMSRIFLSTAEQFCHALRDFANIV